MQHLNKSLREKNPVLIIEDDGGLQRSKQSNNNLLRQDVSKEPLFAAAWTLPPFEKGLDAQIRGYLQYALESLSQLMAILQKFQLLGAIRMCCMKVASLSAVMENDFFF